jgi:DNA-binding MarR family transcriptional regulator
LPERTVRATSLARPGYDREAVSRALDTLGQLNLLRRKPDPADRRSLLFQRTAKGSV